MDWSYNHSISKVRYSNFRYCFNSFYYLYCDFSKKAFFALSGFICAGNFDKPYWLRAIRNIFIFRFDCFDLFEVELLDYLVVDSMAHK